jgi:glutathione synthase/RimK-type ligase-like ATP-grasp enzyme
MRLTGILRDPIYSPDQHADNDRQILELTADALRRRGCRVELIGEAEVGRRERSIADLVFSMCQGPRATAELARLERQGRLIINSPVAVQRCYRVNLLRILGQHWDGLAPMTVVSTTGSAELARLLAANGPTWVKRADVHATQRGDVVKVSSVEECDAALADFRTRGLARAVVQPHIEGTVVKFYGVIGTGFFRFYCERDRKVAPVAFWPARPAVERLVRRVGLQVYGGDAVLTDDGQVVVIDVNDWPSFACFRGEAAETIGDLVYRCAADHLARRLARRPALGHGAAGLPSHHSRR